MENMTESVGYTRMDADPEGKGQSYTVRWRERDDRYFAWVPRRGWVEVYPQPPCEFVFRKAVTA